MNAFIQPMNPARKPCDHRIKVKGSANDDEVYLLSTASFGVSNHLPAAYQHTGGQPLGWVETLPLPAVSTVLQRYNTRRHIWSISKSSDRNTE